MGRQASHACWTGQPAPDIARSSTQDAEHAEGHEPTSLVGTVGPGTPTYIRVRRCRSASVCSRLTRTACGLRASSEWLRLGVTHAGEAFLVGWRHQWDVVASGLSWSAATSVVRWPKQ